MSGGRNLDEELEAQLAGASIPEDDVELAGREVARLEGGDDALGVDFIVDDNPVWGLMEYIKDKSLTVDERKASW
jgi:hypothetical protein